MRSTASSRPTARAWTNGRRSSSSTRSTCSRHPPPFELADDRVVRVVATSTVTGAGIDELKHALFELCPVEPPQEDDEPELPEFLEYRPKPRRGPAFRILRTDRGYRVAGRTPPPGRARGGAPCRRYPERSRGRSGRRGARVAGVTEAQPRLGILGGAFDPPHGGHVQLARAAREHYGLESLLVLVVADPGHKETSAPAEARLELARLAFADVPDTRVELDPHARTVDWLEERGPEDAIFILGGDELAAFARLEGARARPRARAASVWRCGRASPNPSCARRALDSPHPTASRSSR